MRKIEITAWIRKTAAGVLAAAMVVSGTAIVPQTAEAAENTTEVKYEDRTAEFKAMWKEDGTGAAPIMEGSIFGGWFVEEAGEKIALTQEAAAAKLAENPETGVFAKFVPAYVLGVKAQNLSGTTEETASTSTRIISSVDSKDYKAVGATILLNNKKPVSVAETSKVYSGLNVGNQEYTASQIFGQEAEAFCVWRLTNISSANYSRIIYVRPYWVTLDGTKVEGLAKYVHVEDGYKGYVSVPINLMTKEAVAAGILELAYDGGRFEFYDMEAGHVFEEMEKNAGTDSVKIVGNAGTVNQNAIADGLYASVRFKLKEGQSYASGAGAFMVFEVKSEDFSNWNEEDVKIDVWNVQY